MRQPLRQSLFGSSSPRFHLFVIFFFFFSLTQSEVEGLRVPHVADLSAHTKIWWRSVVHYSPKIRQRIGVAAQV